MDLYCTAEYQPNGTKNPMEFEEMEKASEEAKKSGLVTEQYRNGFLECLTETMQYLVVGHGYPPSHGLCPLLVAHLENHCAQIIKGTGSTVMLLIFIFCVVINCIVLMIYSRETSGPRGCEKQDHTGSKWI